MKEKKLFCFTFMDWRKLILKTMENQNLSESAMFDLICDFDPLHIKGKWHKKILDFIKENDLKGFLIGRINRYQYVGDKCKSYLWEKIKN